MTSVAGPTLIHVGRVPAAVARVVLLVGEVVVVPGILLYALVAAGHPMLGLVAVFAWRAGCVGRRLAAGVRVPTTCWLAFGLFLARTLAGIAVSSVSLYLFVPVVLCAAQGFFFIGSAFTRRPVMMRLAADYAGELPERPELRRVFAQVCVIWGGIHVVSAVLGAWVLAVFPSGQAVAVSSMLGVACTVASVGGCAGWGLWRASRIPGLRIVCADKPVQRLASGPVPLAAAA